MSATAGRTYADWLDLQARAAALMTDTLGHISTWDAASPCDDWDARAVLRHVVEEQLWIPGLLTGDAIDAVGERIAPRLERLDAADGPQLVAEWRALVDPVHAAWAAADPDGDVHLSYGAAPTAHYLAQQTSDTAIHAWDLAASQGLDPAWDPALAAAVREAVEADLADNPAPQLFAPPVDAPAGSGDRDAALARTGRDPHHPVA